MLVRILGMAVFDLLAKTCDFVNRDWCRGSYRERLTLKLVGVSLSWLG